MLTDVSKPRAYSYIRFSTPEQAKGHSLKRQREKTLAYIKKNELVLDKSLTFRDAGVSGYTSENLERGAALRDFLDLVDAGKVPRGSYLLIESLDRLTRAAIHTALELLLGLLNRGIVVVTLIDGLKYERTGTADDFSGLIISIAILQRGHDESDTKRKRLNDKWADKRKRIGSEKLTKICPAWLELNSDRTAYTTIPERVALVREIVHLTMQGLGKQKIAAMLNARGVKSIAPSRVNRVAEDDANDVEWFGENEDARSKKRRQSRSNQMQSWHGSYITKLLSNRALIGEFQPHVLDSIDQKPRRRKPAGPAISDYFPAILAVDEFAKLQVTISGRGKQVGGRRGKEFNNLFMGLVRCGYCEGPMVYINKGPDKRGNRDERRNRYFICSNARRGLGCHKLPWVYHEFEEAFFKSAKKVNFTHVLSSSGAETAERTLKDQLTVAKQQVLQSETARKRLVDMLLDRDTTGLDDVLDKIAELKTKSTDLAVTVSRLESELKVLESQGARAQEAIDMLKSVQEQVKTNVGEQHYVFRANLNQHLRQLVDEVKVYPGGQLSTKEQHDAAREKLLKSGCSQDAVDQTLALLFRTTTSPVHRCFMIVTQGQELQVLYPDAKVPDTEDLFGRRQSAWPVGQDECRAPLLKISPAAD